MISGTAVFVVSRVLHTIDGNEKNVVVLMMSEPKRDGCECPSNHHHIAKSGKLIAAGDSYLTSAKVTFRERHKPDDTSTS